MTVDGRRHLDGVVGTHENKKNQCINKNVEQWCKESPVAYA